MDEIKRMTGGSAERSPRSAPLSVTIIISNPNGLHLRVGKDMVYIANRFGAHITAKNLTRPSPVVDVKSILQIMQLQARTGHVIRITADGSDANEAILALRDLLEPSGSPA